MASTSGTNNPYQLALNITCHAWNGDHSMVAVCPNNHEVHIYAVKGKSVKEWERVHVLSEHDQVVTGIDWAPKTNRIVTCAQDRNAYVWRFEGGEWKPTLVILRITRAATCVKWNPDEDKFAVGCGMKCVPVCWFEQENNWWISKIIKKHKSTVLSVAWHPNGVVLATGSSDNKCRVFSAYVKDVDKKKGATNPFGGDLPAFGEVIAEFDQARGWVHSVSWSPNGQQLGWSGHDASIHFTNTQRDVQSIKIRDLPYAAVHFVSDTQLVACGHDFNPHLYTYTGDKWVFTKKVDEGPVKTTGGEKSAVSAAFAKFQSQAKRGEEKSDATESLTTKHHNYVNCICPHGPMKFSTSGLDGRVIVWECK